MQTIESVPSSRTLLALKKPGTRDIYLSQLRFTLACNTQRLLCGNGKPAKCLSGTEPCFVRTDSGIKHASLQQVHTLGTPTVQLTLHCGGTAVADELHMIHECPVLQPLRLQYGALFTPDTDTIRSFFAQQDHMQVLKFVLDCLDFLRLSLCFFFYMRSDCWLAKAL